MVPGDQSCKAKRQLLKYPAKGGGGKGEVLPESSAVGMCGPLPKTLTSCKIKIRDLPYPIYDLAKNSMPYLRTDRCISLIRATVKVAEHSF